VRRLLVAVIGASQPSPEEARLAEEIGARLARAGFAVLSGGMGGNMEAASRGAKEAGGLVVGLLPTSSPDDANPYVDVSIATGISDARNAVIANSADAFVAVGGGLGTLTEIAFALQRRKTVVALKTWQLDRGRLGDEPFYEASTPEQAVRIIEETLAR
jgi:uncharacterized protein (TIGR00725 family)